MPEGVNVNRPPHSDLPGRRGVDDPALIVTKAYWKRRLTKWAENQHLELVSFRGAWFFEGPSACTSSRNQLVFRVVTKDREGLTRYCWITFGTFWGFTWGEPLTKAEWSGADKLSRNCNASCDGSGFGD